MAKAKAKGKPKPAAAKPPLRLEYRSPEELAENPRNWRRHPARQVAALGDLIGEVGWAGACLFNERTKRLIDGHARRAVAIEKGEKLVPVLVGRWTEEQERKILATLDPLAALAEADPAAVASLVGEIETESEAVAAMLADLLGASGAAADLPAPGGGGDEFDATPQETGPTRTQPGDLWVIGGRHRLLVGDCTDAGNVARLMGGKTVGLCFTSPPYAQQRDYGEKAKEKVQDWHALMCGAFAHLPMAPDGQVLVNLGLIHRDGEWVPYWEEWIGWMREQGWRRFGWYVWDQGPGLPGDWNGRCAPAHEFLWHFNREAVQANKTKEKKPENVGRPAHRSTMRGPDGKTKQFSSPDAARQPFKVPDSVFRIGRDRTKQDHPACFPIGFPMEVIPVWSADGGDVFDPFLGSGTTLIAAHRLGRTCYGCEIEPRYGDVVLRRCEAEGLTVEVSRG